jgi:hypothetical protein
MELPDICNILERLSNEKIPAWIIIEEQKMFQKKPKRRGRPRKVIAEDTVSVKDMPSYNPDATINGLTYTIPSWINMIERVFTASEFSEVSKEARNRLTIELNKLTSAAETVAAVLSEVK